MAAVAIPSPQNPHEVVAAFERCGLPLAKVLAAMLNEAPEHRRPRRGCGYTQSSRFLADFVNRRRSLDDVQIFSERVQLFLEKLANQAAETYGRSPRNFLELHQAATGDQRRKTAVDSELSGLVEIWSVRNSVEREESMLIMSLILSVLGVDDVAHDAPDLPVYPQKLSIGTCPEAERFFLELAGGRLRRNGVMNVFVDSNDQPILVEKINIGDSHSCMTLRSVRLNGVTVPAGSLIGVAYDSVPADSPQCAEMNGAWLPMEVADGFRFLRLTTLAVTPKNRIRAFSTHLARQLDGSAFFDPLNTVISELRDVAMRQRPIQGPRLLS